MLKDLKPPANHNTQHPTNNKNTQLLSTRKTYPRQQPHDLYFPHLQRWYKSTWSICSSFKLWMQILGSGWVVRNISENLNASPSFCFYENHGYTSVPLAMHNQVTPSTWKKFMHHPAIKRCPRELCESFGASCQCIAGSGSNLLVDTDIARFMATNITN